MAFPVPDHLPKRPIPVDISSQILYKIDSATKDSLNASLASSWIRELEESIQATKLRIHDRIQSELPKFQHQLETSKSIQSRYEALTTRVSGLNNAISDPEAGIVPTLFTALTKHSALAQEESDAEAVYQAFWSLLQCRNAYTSLTTLVQAGQLPDAVKANEEVQRLIEQMPEYLGRTNVAEDLKRKFSATKARVQDQLSDAYARSICLSSTEIVIRLQVQVRQSETMLQMQSLLHSLSPTSLSNHLATLRRDILSHFVDHVLKQPYSVSIRTPTTEEAALALIPAPPNSEDPSARLENVSTVLDFLSERLFPHLPPSEAVQFTRSLSKPITSSVLNNLLMPTLPSSFGVLPSFLRLLKRAVLFEEKDIRRLLESDRNEGAIKAWADGVSGHYERRRRIEILEHARTEIVAPEDPNDTFLAFSEGGPETSLPSVVPVQEDEDFQDDAWGFDEPATASAIEDAADGWGLDEPITPNPPDSADSWGLDEPITPNGQEPNTDNWGFDDDMDVEPQTDAQPKAVEAQEHEPTKMDSRSDAEPNVADAWGWNDDADAEEPPAEDIRPEDNAWDDPWAEPPSPPAPSVVSPKAATGLAKKLAGKNKKHLNGNGHASNAPSPLSSPPIQEPPPTTITLSPPSPPKPEHPKAKQDKAQQSKHGRLNGTKRPAAVVTSIAPKEQYLVPKRTKRVIKMVETVIDESKLFYASNLFPEAKDLVPAPGSILSQSASSILDLYQALYPIKHARDLESPERGMLFSNSCVYMTGSLQRLEDTLYGQSELKERLTGCRQHLQLLGDSWFDETIERQQQAIDKKLIEGAQGFAFTGDQDRFDDCEMAVNEVMKDIKRLAQRLKGILTKTKYYTAIGSIVNGALSRVLHDVLALPDIPEIESHRLSELCRILNALEGLFSEDPEQPSFVVAYVPNWLKFSYLSELLEASMADTTYLFEQGALVDFQVGELVNLVRALFADTSLRTNTINKLLNGHPMPSR